MQCFNYFSYRLLKFIFFPSLWDISIIIIQIDTSKFLNKQYFKKPAIIKVTMMILININ